ncbi:outer membrane lipoprotein [Nautilia profundicola AmH]|uniref:Outer membrane lipoprotein n=1 Tax=Nautilia profundicola (strain ATCC BAA-1463 / DSM 18972 / AmH) TaxID=598659 RepID=B9L8A0_NAUPA|nr:glycine zipper 2TM domain-containing protein [Nautilia profundicola]ACM93165.1 outer membrane lipoprotein [Nautilia profundicola AmH]
MRKIILAIGLGGLLFTGCTQMYNSNEVALSDVNVMYTYKTGKVESVKKVIIKDDGSGVMTGAVAGTVLGSLFGNGKGNVLTTLIGGLTGAYVGYQADKANGEELYIRLDDGRNIVAIVKGVNIQPGDRVRVVLDGNRIIRVERI